MRAGLFHFPSSFVSFLDKYDIGGRGVWFRKFKRGYAAGRMQCMAPAIGNYAFMVSSACDDLKVIVGAKFRTVDVGVTFVDWITDGTTWRPLDAIWCTGTPEAAITAPIGSLARRTDGGAVTTLYVKETGVGNTGWAAK